MPQSPIALEAVDSVTITTLLDNYMDMLLLDRGPAKRLGLPTAQTPRLAAFIQNSVGIRFEL